MEDRPQAMDIEYQRPDRYQQPYGNLADLNTHRVILDWIGVDNLMALVNTYLDLLGTSSSVYEKNGDYALGIFASRWCRFMDQASRKACGTESNLEAMKCGRWHCHESCSAISMEAIKTGKPADRECLGGIRIFAVPISAGGEVVGAMNFGYGSPALTVESIRQLAERYEVTEEELWFQAEACVPKDPFLIDLAKNNIQTAAQLLGEIILHKQMGHQNLVQSPRLNLVADSGTEPAVDRRVGEIMNTAVDLLKQTLPVDEIQILEHWPGKAQFLLVGKSGGDLGRGESITISDAKSNQAGYTLKTNQTVVVNHYGTETRFQPILLGRQKEVWSGMSAVISGAEKPYGVLLVYSNNQKLFSAKDVSLLETTAHFLGNALAIYMEKESAIRHNRALDRNQQVLHGLMNMVAGELKEPLKKVRVFNEELLRLQDSGSQQRSRNFSERIAAVVQRMEKLVDDLKAYSQVSRQGDVFLKVDLNKVLQEAQVNLEKQILDQNIRIDVQPLPHLNGNPYLLQRLFTQLLEYFLKQDISRTSAAILIESGPLNNPVWEIQMEHRPKGESLKVPMSSERLHKLIQDLQDCQDLMTLQRGHLIADTLDSGGTLILLRFPKD